VLTKEEGGRHTPFFTKYRPQFFMRTADITGTISLPEGTEMIMPGDSATLNIELIADTVMEKGMRFAIREGGKTVGAGIVTKLIGSLGAKSGQAGVSAFARAKTDRSDPKAEGGDAKAKPAAGGDKVKAGAAGAKPAAAAGAAKPAAAKPAAAKPAAKPAAPAKK